MGADNGDHDPTPKVESEPTALPIPKSNDAPSVVIRRPPRNRSLLESVQAHLNSNGRVRSNPNPNTNTNTEPINNKPHTEEAAAADNEESAPAGQYSAPEIMARTRARLAKLKNEPIAGVSPDNDVGVLPPPQTPTPPSSSSLKTDNRVKLIIMDRLEEAKRQAGSIGTETTTTSEKPSLPEDANEAERKLRQQAHLRIKLAAAKRAAVVEEREESLRAKLKGRQV